MYLSIKKTEVFYLWMCLSVGTVLYSSKSDVILLYLALHAICTYDYRMDGPH